MPANDPAQKYAYDNPVSQLRRQSLIYIPTLVSYAPALSVLALPSCVLTITASMARLMRTKETPPHNEIEQAYRSEITAQDIQENRPFSGISISSGPLYETARMLWRKLENRPSFPAILVQNPLIPGDEQTGKKVAPTPYPYPCAILKLDESNRVLAVSQEALHELTPKEQEFMIARELANNALPNRKASIVAEFCGEYAQNVAGLGSLMAFGGAALDAFGLSVRTSSIGAFLAGSLLAATRLILGLMTPLRYHLQDVQEDRNALYLTRDLASATSVVKKAQQRQYAPSRLTLYFDNLRLKALQKSFARVSRYPSPKDWARVSGPQP